MKKIVIDGKVRHGKPIIEGTRVAVEDVLGMLEGGMTYEEIQEEYGLTREEILSVIRYVVALVKDKRVYQLKK
jgi:uncharacterized protein (DUF433 family)